MPPLQAPPRPTPLFTTLPLATRARPVRDPSSRRDESNLARIAERGLALALLILVSPLILAMALLVRLTSPGPAIYRQTRRGLGGRPFTIHKLRTMADRCEAETGPRWAEAEDPRVTPIGQFLREAHLDELPQLWDVARGEMALIGPRPERPELTPRLEREIPRYRERERVRPGITGLAQVLLPPDREVSDVRAKLECDLYYIERKGWRLDLLVMALTVRKVVIGVARAISPRRGAVRA
jgi:lipopolysaccharide/colanic/teichoic acid biosynthesis glycosyltransferase